MTTTTLSARAAVRRRAAMAAAGPVAALGVYLGVLAVRLPGIVVQLGHDSDAVSPMVVAGTLASGHTAGQVHLGNFPNYATIVVDVATANVAGHRVLWTVLPFLVALATVVVLTLTVLRVAGGWAAAVTAVLTAAASPALLEAYATQAYRGSTLLATAVLGWFVVWLTRRPRSRRWVAAVATPVALGAAACLVSDPLLLAAAVAPLAVVGVLLLRPWSAPADRRVAEGVATLAVAVVAVAGALVASRVAAGHGYATSPGATSALPVGGPHHWPDNARLLGESLVHLAQGTTIGEAVSATTLVAAAALLAAAATAAMAVALVSLRGKVVRSAPPPDARDAHLAYWTLSAAAVCAAFVGGSAPTDVKSVRYLVALPSAVAAVVPVWATAARLRRAAVTAGATLFALLAVVQLQRSVDRDAFALQPYAVGQVRLADALSAAGLHDGYAPYFDASALTWTTDGAVTVRPVVAGTTGCPRAMCPVQIYAVDSWYDGSRPGPTFVVFDPLDTDVRGVPATLGRPSSVFSVGRFTVLVYGDDVARRFGRIRSGS